MAAFASGKPTALVIDSGEERTVISAVHEGYCLKKSLVVSGVAGRFVSNEFLKSVVGNGVNVRPRYSFKRKETSPGNFDVVDLDVKGEMKSYRNYSLLEIANDIKQSVCEISPLKKYIISLIYNSIYFYNFYLYNFGYFIFYFLYLFYIRIYT